MSAPPSGRAAQPGESPSGACERFLDAGPVPEVVSALEGLVRAGRGADVVDAMHRAAMGRAGARTEAVTDLMARYESLADVSPGTALLLMENLRPMAGRAKDHTVLDAIRLWEVRLSTGPRGEPAVDG